MFTDEQKGLLATGIIKAEGNMTSGDAHLAVNFPLLLEKGLDGLREKVAERRSRINLTVLEDLHGEQFLKAIDIVLVAVSEHIERFAALAREMAATETRESRRRLGGGEDVDLEGRRRGGCRDLEERKWIWIWRGRSGDIFIMRWWVDKGMPVWARSDLFMCEFF